MTFSDVLAQVTRLLPAAFRIVISVSAILSGSIVAALNLLQPSLEPFAKRYVTLYPPSRVDWFFLCLPVSLLIWLWRRRSNPTAAAEANILQTIDRIDDALRRAKATKIVQNMVWRKIIEEMAVGLHPGAPSISADRLLQIATEQAPIGERLDMGKSPKDGHQ
jgi:hypothetical protein